MKCDRSLYDLACIVHVYEYCCVAYTVYMILHMQVYMYNHFDCLIFGIAPASPTPPPTHTQRVRVRSHLFSFLRVHVNVRVRHLRLRVNTHRILNICVNITYNLRARANTTDSSLTCTFKDKKLLNNLCMNTQQISSSHISVNTTNYFFTRT